MTEIWTLTFSETPGASKSEFVKAISSGINRASGPPIAEISLSEPTIWWDSFPDHSLHDILHPFFLAMLYKSLWVADESKPDLLAKFIETFWIGKKASGLSYLSSLILLMT